MGAEEKCLEDWSKSVHAEKQERKPWNQTVLFIKGGDPFDLGNSLEAGMANIIEYESLHAFAFQLLKKVFRKKKYQFLTE